MALHENEDAGNIRTRDWIAVKAMQGIVSSEGAGNLTRKEHAQTVAKAAYQVAEAMLRQSQVESASGE
jgi:hypothetical protein